MSKPTYTREEFLNSCITPATSSPFLSTECPICQEEYCDSSGVCAVTFSDEKTCNHAFCRCCITAWLSKERVNTCAVCRRVLFDLKDSSSIDGDDYDDEDYDEEYDEDDDEEEGYEGDFEDEESIPPVHSETNMEDELPIYIPADRYRIVSREIIHDILVSIWYKTWWLLGGYRCYVLDVHNGSPRPAVGYSREGISSDKGMHRLPNGLCLVRTFLSTIFVIGIDFDYVPNDPAAEMLDWLLQDIAASIKAHIDTTNGSDEVPEFPEWKRRIWGEPMQWLLAVPKERRSMPNSHEGAQER